MADKPPPSRYSVVERGGRLVVVDRETGQTPPTAAERMAEHDRRMGVEAIRPATRVEPVAPNPAKPPPSPPLAIPSGSAAAPNRKQPWQEPGQRPGGKPNPPRARKQQPPTGAAQSRKTIVTGKWWDAKGPRTVELGPKALQKLANGFAGVFFGTLALAILLLFITPIALFVGAFLLFRFGGGILGPIGAGIVDRALAEKG